MGVTISIRDLNWKFHQTFNFVFISNAKGTFFKRLASLVAFLHFSSRNFPKSWRLDFGGAHYTAKISYFLFWKPTKAESCPDQTYCTLITWLTGSFGLWGSFQRHYFRAYTKGQLSNENLRPPQWFAGMQIFYHGVFPMQPGESGEGNWKAHERLLLREWWICAAVPGCGCVPYNCYNAFFC